MANNSINFNIGFKVNDSGLKQARAALDQFLNNGVNAKQLSLINQQDLNTSLKMIGDATKEVGKFEAAMTQAYNVKLGTVNLERFNEELTKNGTSLQNFKEKMMQLGPTGQQAYAQMASGLMNVKYETVETTTLLDKLGDSLRRALLTFTSLNIINKVKGSIGEAYGYVKNLDSSLNDIRIVTGKSADEMDRFAEKANKAAASLGKATTDYTKASTIFYQQGLGNEDVEARTEVALKVANTTGADTSKAADQLTAIWNGFNIGAEDAEKSIDVVAAVAAKTASNLDEMATAMSKVASMANSMGVSEEQLAAQLSTVIAVTRQAPESVGTAFKTIYARIADIKAGSEDAEISLGNYSGQLSALGINVLDTAGNLKDMGQVIEEVGASWGNYSKEQQVAIAGIMGGQRQVNQIRALFDNWDKYTETMKVAAEAEGTLQQQQDTYMESAEGQLQKLRTEWEGVLDSLLKAEDIIKVAKNVSPLIQSLEKVVDALGGGVGILTKFSPLLFNLISPQIVAGLGKINTSFKVMQTNAEKDAIALQAYNNTFKDVNLVDTYSSKIQELYKRFFELRDSMSTEQKNAFLTSIKDFAEKEGPNAERVVQNLITEVEKITNGNFGNSSKLKDVLEIDSNTGQLINLQGLEDFDNKIEQLKEKIRNIDLMDSSSIEELKQEYLDVLGTIPQELEEQLNNSSYRATLEETISDLRDSEAVFADQAIAQLEGELEEFNNNNNSITFNTTEAINELSDLQDGLNQTRECEQDVERETTVINDGLSQLGRNIDQVSFEKITQQAANVVQGFIAISAAFSQIKNLGSVWDNEDLTTSEKMSQTLATIGSILAITIPSVIAAIKSIKELANAHLIAATTAKLQAIANGELTTSILTQAAANWVLNASMVKIVVVLTAIAAAIGIVVLGFKTWEKENRKSSENLKEANERLDEAKTKYDELKSSLDKYKDIKDTFKDLKEGTQEWKDAVRELNDEVLSLIEKYPELQQFVQVGKGGALSLDEEGLAEFEKIQEKEYKQAQGASFLAGLTTKRDKEDKLNSLNKKYGNNEASQSQYNQWLKEAEEKDKKLIQGYLSTLEEYENASESQLAAAANEIWDKFDGDTKKIQESFSEKDLSNLGIIKQGISKFGEILAFIIDYWKKFFMELANLDSPIRKLVTTIGLIIPQFRLLTLAVNAAQQAFEFIFEKYRDEKQIEENTKIAEAGTREANDEYFKYKSGKNITISDMESGNYGKASQADIDYLQNLAKAKEGTEDYQILEKLAFNSGKSVEEYIKIIWDYQKGATEALNSYKQAWNESLDIEVIEAFEGKLTGLGNTIKQELGQGITELSNLGLDEDQINEIGVLLADIGTDEGMQRFNEYLEENHLKWEQLPQGILNYRDALELLNSTTNVSIDSISNLMSVMSKTSSIKFGDTFSAKDFEEIQSVLEKAGIGWENFFTKVGDKFKFIGTDVKEFSKAMDDAFIAKVDEAEKQFEGLRNIIKHDNLGFSFISTSDILNLGDSVLDSLEGWTSEGAKDIAKKIIEGTATEEEITAYNDLIKKIQEAAQNDQYFNEKRAEWADEYIGSYVHNLDTLQQKLEDGLILQEDVDKHLEQVRREELQSLGISEEAYEHYADTIKKITGNENLKDFQVVAKLKLELNGEDYAKQVADAIKDMPDKSASSIAEASSKISLLFSKQLGWDISSEMIGNNLDLIEQILKGSEEAEAQFIEGYIKAISEASRNGQLTLAKSLQEELAHLKNFFDASKEYAKKSAEEIQKSLIEMAEAQNAHNRSLTQRKIGKTEDRLSHSVGQEYVDNYKILQQQREKEKDYMRESISNKQKLLALVNEEIAKDEDNIELQEKRQSIENEIIDLQNEIIDYDEAQIVNIDKTADEKRKVTVAQKQLTKLEKESALLNGDALIDNLKEQKKLRKEIAEATAAEGKQLIENLKTNQNAIEQMLKTEGIKIDVEYLWDGSIGNYEEIMAEANEVGGDFAERLKELIDKTNESADALADFVEAVEDAASSLLEETKYSNTEREIKKLQRENKKDEAIIAANPNSVEAIEAQQRIDNRNEEIKNKKEYIAKDTFKTAKEKAETTLDEKEYETLISEQSTEHLRTGLKTFLEGLDKDKTKWTEEETAKVIELTNKLQVGEDYLKANEEYNEYLDEYETGYRVAAQGVDEYTHSLEENEKAHKKLNAAQTEESYVLQNLKDEQSLLYGDDLVANLEEQERSIQRTVALKEKELELEKQKKKILGDQQKDYLGKAEVAKGALDTALKGATDKNGKQLTAEDIASIYNEDGTINKDRWEELGITDELWSSIEKDAKTYQDNLTKAQDAEEKINESTVNIAKNEQEVTKSKKDQLEIDRKIAQEKLKVAEDAIKRDTDANHALSKALLDVDKAIEKVQRKQSNLSGPALIQSMQQEIHLQQQKKKILEQQYEQIKAQIQALIALYSLHFSTEYHISVGFNVDETGVTNIDELYKAIEGVDSDRKAAAMQDLQNFSQTLNGLAGNALSAKKSVDSLSNSIEDLNKKIEDTQKAELFRVKEERWSNIDQELKKIARELSRVEKLQKNLTGDALIKNLEHQQQLLEKQAEAQKNKLGIMKAELQTMQTMLALEGVLFTSDGLIANYAAVMAKGDEKLNGYMQSYQQFYDQIGDLEDSILDTYDKKADLEAAKMAERLRMFNTKIDVELDLTKAKREWQNFKREFLNTLNDMSQLNDSIAEKCKQNVKDIKDMTTKDTVMLTDHVNDIIQEIKIMQAGGTSDLYGIDQATALSDLANYRQQLQDTLSSLADKIKETEEAFLQQLEKIKSKFDDQIGNYETIQSIIEHDMNLIKLLRGDDAYDELANYYDKSTKNYEAELQTLRQQVDYWKNLMDSAQPGTEEWEKFQSNWKDALNKLNSAVDAAVQNLIDKYKNAINKIMADFEKKITNGSSLDTAKQRWDWQKQQADFFLDTITKEYEIEKLRMEINKAAEDESDPAKRAKILQIGDKQLKQLQSLTKVRQYDVDLANKQLELELKKQELEDAKNQKTSMRLRRDAEGNYRYEYVADQDKIDELKESILDAEQDIYEFTVKNQRDLQDQMYENVKEFEDAIRDLVSRRNQMTEDEYNAELQRIEDHFGFMDDAIRGALDKAAADVTDAATTEAIDLGLLYQEQLDKMSELQKRKFAEDIVPTFISAITEMKDIIDGEGGLINAAKIAFDELDSAFNELQNELNDIQAAAGVDFDTIIAGIDDTINEMQALIEDNDELLVQYQEELDVIRDLIDELHDLMDAYRDVYDAAMDAIDVALELRETAREAMEEYNDLNSMVNDIGGTAGGASTSTGNGKVPTGNYAATKNMQYLNSSGLVAKEDVYYHAGIDSKGNTKIFSSTDSSTFASVKPGQTYIAKDGTEYKLYGNENTTNIDTARREAKILEDDKQYAAHVAGHFDTGGYTGAWGNEGKIAILHEKELVLNQDDTKNILRAVAQVRANTQIGLSSNDFNILSNMVAGIHNIISDIYSTLVNNQADTLTQQAAAVSNYSAMNNSNITNNINANFPNAGNMNEIKSAIMGLSNYASQKIHSNQRLKNTSTPNAYRTNSF